MRYDEFLFSFGFCSFENTHRVCLYLPFFLSVETDNESVVPTSGAGAIVVGQKNNRNEEYTRTRRAPR